MISFSHEILTRKVTGPIMPDPVAFPMIGIMYVPDGAVDNPPLAPPFTVIVIVELQEEFDGQELGLNDAFVFTGTDKALSKILDVSPVGLGGTVTVTVPVVLPEIGLTTVMLAGALETRKLEGELLLS